MTTTTKQIIRSTEVKESVTSTTSGFKRAGVTDKVETKIKEEVKEEKKEIKETIKDTKENTNWRASNLQKNTESAITPIKTTEIKKDIKQAETKVTETKPKTGEVKKDGWRK